MPRRDISLAALVILIWGVNFVAAAIGMETLPPLLLSALRFALVAFPAILFVKPPEMGFSPVVVSGTCMGALQFGLLYSSTQCWPAKASRPSTVRTGTATYATSAPTP